MIVRRILRPLSRLLATRDSVAALEFALLAPTFVVAFAGVVDLGNALYTWSKLEQALALGANYALLHGSQVGSANGGTLASNLATMVSTSNPGTAANATIVVNDGPTVTVTNGTSASSGTATNADNFYCLTGAPRSWTWGNSVTYASSCAAGGLGGQFVTITVSYNYTPFFASYGFVTNGAMTAGAAIQTK